MSKYNSAPKKDEGPEFTKITTDDIVPIGLEQDDVFSETGVRNSMFIISSPGSGKTSQGGELGRRLADRRGKEFYEGPDPGPDQFGYVEKQMANTGEEVTAGLPTPNRETTPTSLEGN